jgi:hypothetical protein
MGRKAATDNAIRVEHNTLIARDVHSVLEFQIGK